MTSLLGYVVWKSILNFKYDEEIEDTETDASNEAQEEDVHSDDYGDTESEEEKGFDDDERD